MRDLPQQSGGQDLRHYLRLVWLWKWWLLAVITVIPVGVYLVSARTPKTYESSTTLFVQQTSLPSEVLGGTSFYTSSVEVTARLMRTTAVARRVARILGEPPNRAGALLGEIKIGTETGQDSTSGSFLTITGSAGNPQRAARVANAFARAVTNARYAETTQQVKAAIRNLRAQAEEANGPEGAGTRTQLATQIQQLNGLLASQTNSTRVIEPARPSSTPVSPKPRANAAIAFVLALLLAAGLVPLLERMDRRIRDAEELEPLLGVPLLVLVPEGAFGSVGSRTSFQVRESFQTLRASLTTFNVDRSLKTVVISSTTHGEGKTTVASNLAVALAQDERDVVLIEGDMRRPQMLARFGSKKGWGLDSVLLGERKLDETLREIDVEGGGRLRLLPGGTGVPNPAVLLGSQRMRSLLEELSGEADMIVIDTPPILSVSDAIPLIEYVSGTVLIARVDYTSRDALLRAAQVVQTAGGTLLGVVATGTRAGGLYGYDDYAYAHPGGRMTSGGWGADEGPGLLERIKRGFNGRGVAGRRSANGADREADEPVAGAGKDRGKRG